jgi:peptidoglycan/LPS O-acetylase OafA/YrhL
MRVHVVFIGLGLIFLVVGMVFGIWMGITQNFQFLDAHAHWNLVGFVTSTLYGLIHRAYPKLATSRLTWVQCITHVLGVLIFAPGIIVVVTTHNEMPAIIGSLLIVSAALMFMWIYFTHDHRTNPD